MIQGRTSFRRLFFTASVFLSASFLTLATLAQDNVQFDPAVAGSRLSDIDQQLDTGETSSEFLDNARAEAVDIAAAATACYVAATEERERISARYEPLADISPDVDAAIWDQRLQLQNQRDRVIQRQTECGGIRDDANELVRRISAVETAITQKLLLNRTDSIIGLLNTLPGRLAALPGKARNAVDLQVVAGTSPATLLWLLLAGGILAAAIGLYFRHRFNQWFERAGGMAAEPQVKYLFPKPLAQFSPLLLEGMVLLGILLISIENASFDMIVVRIAAGILLYGIGCTITDWATGPLSPSASIKGFIPDHVRPLRLRLRFFILALVASFVVLGTNWLSIRLVDPSVGGRATMIFLVAVSLLMVLSYLRRIRGLRHRFRLVRYVGMLTLLGGIVVLLLGYQNLAGYLIHGATRTALALMVLWILLWLVYQGFSFLMNPDLPSATRLRRSLGLRKEGSLSGVGFLQLIADLVLWLSFVVYLIYVWDESGTTLDELIVLIEQGYTFGDIRLVPLQIIGGILVFAGVIILIGWIKGWIESRWLQHIVPERGAREAIITLIGYVGFLLAALVGLSMAGVDLGGLAIVSGALALGIGFGMQEIASNFVSGLILLFERPIRAGDFVSVGDIEGFVRRIRIRATEIETLDNQNVLVPNSELVSGRVTNWVLRDPQGRLRIHVGVAYGSDVDRVKNILEQVANEHSEVITDGRAPAPRALFMGFGDSSLDFELRVRIQRIERRFSVLSDINFAIDRAFREERIEIPYPQRDLHIVSYPDTTTAVPATEAEPTDPEQTIRSRIMHHPEHVTRSLREDVTVEASSDEVWNSITDIDALGEWLAKDGEFRPFIGGPFALNLRDDTEMSGRIDIFLPPRRMRLVLAPRKDEEPLASGPITIDFILKDEDKEQRTELTVIVAGIPASEDWEADYRRAEDRWHNAFVELKEYLTQK